MPQLQTLSVGTPGWRGLNKQQSGSVLPPGWATKALNFVIDDQGRMAVRDGTREVTTAAVGAGTFQTLHYYLDKDSNEVLIGACNNKIYRKDSTSWTDVSGTMTAPSADNWQFVNFNGKVVGWQEGETPVVMATTAGTFADIVPAAGGTIPSGRALLAAFGRLWVLDKDTLYYSDTLDETTWYDATTPGLAGATALANVWPKGVDIPVGLSEFNGKLVIFGKTQIIIYGGPDDPTSAFSEFVKQEGISGLGCLARDSIQVVGRDVIFLSGKGIRMLGRVIQEKSNPITDAAPQVRDFVLQQAADSTANDIKSLFSTKTGFYLLVLKNNVLAFDLRFKNEDGSYRVTEWDPGFTGVAADTNGDIVLGKDDQVYSYTGRLDNVTSTGTGGDDIHIDFEGVWNDFSNLDPALGLVIKFLKRVKVYVNGGAGQTIAFKWAVDYASAFIQRNISIPAGTGEARWGTAQYSLARYSGDVTFNTVSTNAGRSGRVLKIGIVANIGDVPFALDRIDVYATTGKLSL